MTETCLTNFTCSRSNSIQSQIAIFIVSRDLRLISIRWFSTFRVNTAQNRAFGVSVALFILFYYCATVTLIFLLKSGWFLFCSATCSFFCCCCFVFQSTRDLSAVNYYLLLAFVAVCVCCSSFVFVNCWTCCFYISFKFISISCGRLCHISDTDASMIGFVSDTSRIFAIMR